MLSNPYYEQKAIDYLDVSIQQKSSGLQLVYAFTDATTIKEWQASTQYLSIDNMSYQQEDISALTMRFKPYQTSCIISIQQKSITTGEINMTLAFTNNPTLYCFALTVGTCTLQQVSCPNL
jgi:diacylglycerol kinase family enzyme